MSSCDLSGISFTDEQCEALARVYRYLLELSAERKLAKGEGGQDNASGELDACGIVKPNPTPAATEVGQR